MLDYQKLDKNPLFKAVKLKDIKKIINCFDEIVLDKDKVIFFEQDIIKTIYIVIEGFVSISKYDLNGNKSIVTIIEPYDMFAESIALSAQQISPYTVETIKKSKIIAIDVAKFHELTNKIPQLATNTIILLATKCTYLTFKIDCLSKRTIRERVFELFKYYHITTNSDKIMLPYNRSQLAEFLCVNRSALTRELSIMEADEIFTYKNKTYYLNSKFF